MRAGSSPLTRGKPVERRPEAGENGLIPAHAGKTLLRLSRRRAARAHPRSRGENLRAGLDLGGEPGSSPLTRGKRGERSEDRSQAGLIPAHAGKTAHLSDEAAQAGAHPRSRGENMPEPGRLAMRAGSSPLTRGKPRKSPRQAGYVRLIPAHAGKTASRTRQSRSGPAHPRSRGENGTGATVGRGAQGSSPLTRGKLTRRDSDVPSRGLIPAHAGKTMTRRGL